MQEIFERYTCWTEKSASEAGFYALGTRTAVNDGMVAATKVEIPLNPFGSSEVISIDQMIERFISELDIEQSNSVFAITGDSGSGKTFAIRCAQTRVEADPRVHVVYVHRDVTSLQGILKLILSGLPGKQAADALRQVEETNVEELDTGSLLKLVAAQIVVELELGHGLGEMLEGETITKEDKTALKALYGENEGGKFKNGLGAYIDIPEVKAHLLREGGVLWNHVQAMRGEGDGEPISEFVKGEISLIRKLPRNSPLADFFFFLNERPDLAARIIDAVRERALGAQVQTTRNLTEIVEEARRILNDEGKQLVLMFEDIAKNGVGLSDAVFDLFRVTVNEGVKPIRVMFAATTGHWPRIPPNVRNNCTRVEVRSLSLENPDSMEIGLQIIAQYFNAARVGEQEILVAWNGTSVLNRGLRNWIPNKCEECKFRTECHNEFGAVDGIGLYPLNKNAAVNVLRHLQSINELDGHVGYNPRQIVKTLIAEWLRNSESAMKLNTFPSARTEEIVGNRVSKARIVNNTSEDEKQNLPAEMLARVFRTRVAWANYDQTKEDYSEGLAKAFGLKPSNRISPSLTPTPHPAPLPKGGDVKTIKWFQEDFGDVADWAAPDSQLALSDGRVDFIRPFLLELVMQHLRLDRYLIDQRSNEVENLVLTHLREVSIRIDGSKGQEINKARMQKQILRSYDSYLMVTAAFWLNSAKSWQSEFVRGSELIKCDPTILFKGRRVLMEWVETFADEVAQRVKLAIEDATEAALTARLRLAALMTPSILISTQVSAISDLTNFSNNSVLDDLIEPDSSIEKYLIDFDALIARSITAYQGTDGNTRLAEDFIIKNKVLKNFKESPDWRSTLSVHNPDELVSFNAKVESFSIEIANKLETGELSVQEFRNEIKDLDFGDFQIQLDEFNLVFESLLMHGHSTKDPKFVRKLVETLNEGLQTLIVEKDSILNSTADSEEMSDPEIWRLIQRFPFLNGWTQSYRSLISTAQEINSALDERVGGQVLHDVDSLRAEINKSLADIQLPSEEKSND